MRYLDGLPPLDTWLEEAQRAELEDAEAEEER
jgi:hypothetical protein